MADKKINLNTLTTSELEERQKLLETSYNEKMDSIRKLYGESLALSREYNDIQAVINKRNGKKTTAPQQ